MDNCVIFTSQFTKGMSFPLEDKDIFLKKFGNKFAAEDGDLAKVDNSHDDPREKRFRVQITLPESQKKAFNSFLRTFCKEQKLKLSNCTVSKN